MSWLGSEMVHLARCQSTNDEAAQRGSAGGCHGLVVIADAQDAGRGRLARTWHSPPGGNLYMSCLLRPDLVPSRVPPITLAAGIAVVNAVNSFGARSSIKWPNDVMGRDNRKIAGILTEMNTRGEKVDQVILGIGVNLHGDQWPDELVDIATSVSHECGSPVERDDFLAVLLPELETWVERYVDGGVPAIADAWTDRAALGPVEIQRDGGTLLGHARGLHTSGALLVEDDSGTMHSILAGDVTSR